VDRAYFAVLRSLSVLRVADQTVQARQLLLDQVTAMEAGKLKSGLDVSFGKVNLSDAKLLLIGAQNEKQAALAELSAALGYRDSQDFDLQEEEMPAALGKDPASFVEAALRSRPDLLSLRLSRDSAYRFAEAEKDLSRPLIGALAATGLIPLHDDKLTDRYSAAGVNVSIPIFNGRLFSARRQEAELRAKSLDEIIRSVEDQISRDVRLAWLSAGTFFERLDVTQQLLQQATQSLDLAQGRYELGLSSIVELNQALLNKTAAEIAVATAKYDYQMQRAFLDFQTGVVR
jgi:outer membrane protein